MTIYELFEGFENNFWLYFSEMPPVFDDQRATRILKKVQKNSHEILRASGLRGRNEQSRLLKSLTASLGTADYNWLKLFLLKRT